MSMKRDRLSRARSGFGLALAAALAVPAVLTPAGETLAGSTDFTVQYLNENAATPNDTIAEASIRIRNNTGASVPLSNIVVRYWLTKNSAPAVTPACWWWNPACSNITLVTGSASATGADTYVEIRFTSGAGSLAAGATTQPIDLGITFGANTNETDDYSYGNQSSFVDWSKITVHDAGSTPTGGLRGGTLPSSGGGGVPSVSAEFFDDFTYSGNNDPNFTNLWSIRTWAGGPGISGAQWLTSNVSVVTDPANGSNKLLRLQGSTTGTGAGSSQSEVMSKSRKFRLGTYASRVKFNDNPVFGNRYYGDKPIETFFTITPYVANNPNYSEQDFEYMPNGGWGQGNTNTMWLTSWETTTASSGPSPVSVSFNGWHTVMLHITNSTVDYYIDGYLEDSHDPSFVPEEGQYLAYQVWFDEIATGQSSSRTYNIDTDWVYFAKDTILTAAQVDAKVASLRSGGLPRKDTVP